MRGIEPLPHMLIKQDIEVESMTSRLVPDNLQNQRGGVGLASDTGTGECRAARAVTPRFLLPDSSLDFFHSTRVGCAHYFHRQRSHRCIKIVRTCPAFVLGFFLGIAQQHLFAGLIAPNKTPFGGIRAAFR